MDCRTGALTERAIEPKPHVAGPAQRLRASAPEAFFEAAFAAALRCGVTRLADITGLDRIGLPVWQAVRPGGRSLSVHQGKGATPLAARIGALCEAIEAHCAEQVPADGPCCPLAALPASERAPEMGDYCGERAEAPGEDEPVRWCLATDHATGRGRYLPHALVSLDYRTGLPSPFDRTSSGLGVGATASDALVTALLEIIERDAVGEWNRLTEAERLATSVDLDGIPFDWFRAWRDRLASLAVDLQVFRIESIAGIPVFKCLIGGVEEFGPSYRRFAGMAADGDAEVALFGALAEALQSRLTVIAAVRDDFLPDFYARSTPERRAAGGPPRGTRPWQAEGPLADDPDRIADSLAASGFPGIVFRRLDEDLPGVAVVKAFVPGLGSLSRTRRPGR